MDGLKYENALPDSERRAGKTQRLCARHFQFNGTIFGFEPKFSDGSIIARWPGINVSDLERGRQIDCIPEDERMLLRQRR